MVTLWRHVTETSPASYWTECLSGQSEEVAPDPTPHDEAKREQRCAPLSENNAINNSTKKSHMSGSEKLTRARPEHGQRILLIPRNIKLDSDRRAFLANRWGDLGLLSTSDPGPHDETKHEQRCAPRPQQATPFCDLRINRHRCQVFR